MLPVGAHSIGETSFIALAKTGTVSAPTCVKLLWTACHNGDALLLLGQSEVLLPGPAQSSPAAGNVASGANNVVSARERFPSPETPVVLDHSRELGPGNRPLSPGADQSVAPSPMLDVTEPPPVAAESRNDPTLSCHTTSIWPAGFHRWKLVCNLRRHRGQFHARLSSTQSA